MDYKMVKVARCPSEYSGSDTISGLDGSGTGVEVAEPGSGKQHRMRTVRLVRPTSGSAARLTSGRQGPLLGFSLRGGREHGTGFFVSAVQASSEAHRQGLRIGDQIVRINGYSVEDAIHKEVLLLIASHKHISLKVRHVGMVPIKEKISDPLGWQMIDDTDSIKRGSPTLRDIKISIAITHRSKLGCGICKGPDWKPGIFIQFIKEGGIAHEVGLKPGDQILLCNDVDFNGIAFNEAVHILKTSRQLELVVRQGAGMDLVTAESSGYNSSASSVTGDQSPSSADSKRLSIVKEETLELEDRLSQLDSKCKSKLWNESKWNTLQSNPPRNCKPTIITLSAHETTIQNNGIPEICQSSPPKVEVIPPPMHPPEMHTVVAQIHRTAEEEEKCPKLTNGAGENVVNGSASGSEPNSLSSAIFKELQRRSERNKANLQALTEQKETKKPLKEDTLRPKLQHDILMDEFRKAHLKMFSNSDKINESKNNITPKPSEALPATEVHRAPSTKPKAPPVPKKTYNEVIPPIPPCPAPDYDTCPPPPPFMPDQRVATETEDKAAVPAPPVARRNSDTVEMESLESFQLNNPSGPEPKPPRTYFNKPKVKLTGQSSVSSATSYESVASMQTSKKRAVSVTFSEYPSGIQRRPPGRFGFLNGTKSCDYDERDSEPITSRLASELSQTLLRANLKLNNESELTNSPRKLHSSSSVTISVNNNTPTIQNNQLPSYASNQHKPLTKTQSVNNHAITNNKVQNLSNGLSNKLTIRISEHEANKICDTAS